MAKSKLEKAIDKAQNLLTSRQKKRPEPLLSKEEREFKDRMQAAQRIHTMGADGTPAIQLGPEFPPKADPVWQAINSLKPLWDLLPDARSGVSRLSQCITLMRNVTEQDQFPDAVPDRPYGDSVCPIHNAQGEANKIIESAKPVILRLLDLVEVEHKSRTRLQRELGKPTPFFEPDARGTVGFLLAPRGLTQEMARNNVKLEAIANFLDVFRRQPFVVIHYALRLLKDIAIPPELLSANVIELTVTFRRTKHHVSEATCYWIQKLIAAQGSFVSISDLQKELVRHKVDSKGQIRNDRLVSKLPTELKKAIITDPRGSRLEVEVLLSNL